MSPPIGIWIGAPVAITSVPLLKPSDESIAIVRTVSSPELMLNVCTEVLLELEFCSNLCTIPDPFFPASSDV